MFLKLSKYEKHGKLGSVLSRIPGAQIVMSVRWFTYQVLDPTLDWTAVICRGLRETVTKREIDEALSTISARAEPPRIISSHLCSIIIVKNIVDAEKLLKNYLGFGFGGRADIHPYSSICKSPEQTVELLFHDYRKKKAKNLLQAVGYKFNLYKPEDSEDAKSLISSVSETVEDGEITETSAPASETTETYYMLFEQPGNYVNRDGEVSSHSGVCVKTLFSFQNNN